MPNFAFKAVNSSGRTVTGEIEASDRKKLIQQLSGRGLRPIHIESKADNEEAVEGVESIDFYQTGKKGGRKLFAVSSKEVISLEFLKRLHVLLGSGMSLGDAVNLMNRRLSDPKLKELCEQIWKQLSEGRTLASAMQNFRGYFNLSTIHMIEAGEASGNLVPILDRVIAYKQESREVKKTLLSSLTYPAVILTVAILVVILLLTFLLPKIKDILSQLGGDLPFFAKILIGGADYSTKYGPFGLAIAAVVGLALFQYRKTSAGRRKTDYWMLRVPILGKIALYSNIYSITNLLSTLLGSGINTTESLRLVERSIENRILHDKFAIARRQIQEGVNLATAIERVKLMPQLAMDILTVGENTGNIVSSLDDVNKIYREELTRALNFLINATVAIALGGAILLVALIALSVVISVISVGQSIQL